MLTSADMALFNCGPAEPKKKNSKASKKSQKKKATEAEAKKKAQDKKKAEDKKQPNSHRRSLLQHLRRHLRRL